MSTITQDIQHALRLNEIFIISTDADGNERVEALGLGNRILHWGNSQYHTNRILRIAEVLTNSLQRLSRLPIQVAANTPEVVATRAFFRTINRELREDTTIKNCAKELLAAKLGIQRQQLEASTGFEKFAQNNFLEKYLLHYGDNIQFSHEKQEIEILCEGRFQPWSSVATQQEGIPEPIHPDPTNLRQPWYYGPNGIQKKDMYVWEKLEPYKIESNPDWGNRYIAEYCTCCGDSVQFSGDHSWLRLKCPNGEIYSIGLYRPGKSGSKDNYYFPLRVKKGYITSPDVSEFYPVKTYRFSVEITDEQFKKIKESIEEDKQNEETRVFHLNHDNCTEYVNSKFAIAGIKLPTEVHVAEYVSPNWVKTPSQFVYKKLPSTAQKVSHTTLSFFTNLVLFGFGTGMVDHDLKERNIEVKTHISSVWDLFKVEKAYFHPPRHVALVVCQEILEWQAEQGDEGKYGVPEKYLF